jgi:hypothetical protein
MCGECLQFVVRMEGLRWHHEVEAKPATESLHSRIKSFSQRIYQGWEVFLIEDVGAGLKPAPTKGSTTVWSLKITSKPLQNKTLYFLVWNLG